MKLFTLFLVFCMASLVSSRRFGSSYINVMNYGAFGDGKTDDSQAFTKAWEVACGAKSANALLYIPKGRTFLLKPVKFEGPCRSSSISVQVLGNIVAPGSISAWSGTDVENWIVFSKVDGLTINGNGQIDGKGSIWWHVAKERPGALAFNNCNNLQVSGLTHVNSPRSHISIDGCHGVTMSNLHITTPESSPNTDGIDIGQSNNVQIRDCYIGTGDDCIAILAGSSYIKITGVACGPGHGISVGSLGENESTATVEEVHVKNCSFSGTMFGARIKTWQGGSGYARKITFEEIRLVAAAKPIVIDQFYCIGGEKCSNKTSAIKVSDISYVGFQGTSTTEEAITFKCSQNIGCTNILLDGVNITLENSHAIPKSSCFHAYGKSTNSVPDVNCLL